MHIDQIFDTEPFLIWTGDMFDENQVWALHLPRGECLPITTDFFGGWVRAVR